MIHHTYTNPSPLRLKWPKGAQCFIAPGYYKITNGRTWVWGIDDWYRSKKTLDEVNLAIRAQDNEKVNLQEWSAAE